ncbi:SgcJ/EcaC family oxidoreductase [Fictibacillus sp. b24]|uniref:SgcJ/EcaC family oxidoreductase n=1 Tax=Fictibacillus sp. b24 TaxID=3055863 RepID=UPI0025A23D9D|nr:SgcJ/EcaC family oxidoreductase [Fictibacillus sp. b24]MDM5318099.1 SgcJ/EcaC family oxidoreductase [Fictibacillus sp. b24]
MNIEATQEIRNLYQQFLNAWNERNARGMADHFTEDGEMIGYDGSQAFGPDEVYSHLEPIFSSFPTPPYYAKVKNVSFLSEDAVILRAIAGMIPMGKTELSPELNTHHTVVAVKKETGWFIKLFQNTPAQFHGRPELVEKFTDELKKLLPK